MEKPLPLVALAGRPNVGKSTLFNRLLHKRRSITDPTPGVTRDPVIMNTVILGKPLRLADTGGFKLDRNRDTPEGELERIVVERALEILKEADLVILLFEAGELTLEDEEFINVLRPYREKLIAVVNKTEGGRREAESWNLLSYGFDKILMISAEHGDNIANLEEAIAGRIRCNEADTAPEEPAEPAQAPVRIALLGKPNTGKSTLSNRLTSSSASIVSDIPGTTRDVVEGSFVWKNRNFMVLDTAGIRRKSRVNENIEYYSVNRAIKSIDEADIVFLVIDAQEGFADQDKKIAALAHDKGRGLILVLNKWDTMPDVKNTFEAVRDRIHFFFGQMEYAPIIALSALDGKGIDELLNTSLRMYNQLNRQIETATLNQALEKWLTEYPPPSGPQTRFKIRYAVQKGANPVKFVFFASRSNAVTEPYIAYLRNRIRRDLGFSLVPLDIEIRSSSKGHDEWGRKESRKKRS
ncbi:MAG: ribosome biogenesis GTPase Der [Treponema sp.]|nr:ribosome biogenesis GTPase Der [Treponema sp.]